jgi:nephrocystin-3
MTTPTSRVVRVFISSTFRDFGAERGLLMKRVFPELRRRARARFVEVIGVDLRWGFLAPTRSI